ncbi:MAG TPA: class I SAM-dependent methyltransferase [Ilumatobacteraceae bacterium]|nr:class I SAM-dependent methyltransferase [Ilumatobacteraceae bacterium]
MLERMRELTVTLQRSDEFPFSMVLDPTERDLQTGDEEWAPSYDGPNPMIETEERVAHPILRELAEPGRRALDAACGTGRQASLALCHLSDPGDAVTELARVLRPGGTLVITNPHPFGGMLGG